MGGLQQTEHPNEKPSVDFVMSKQSITHNTLFKELPPIAILLTKIAGGPNSQLTGEGEIGQLKIADFLCGAVE